MATGVNSSQLRFQITILSKLTTKTGVYVKYKITLILRSILIDIHFPPRTHVPNFLAYS